MRKILRMLLPKTLVIAKSVEPLPTEARFTTNSGMLVPMATMVSPMTRLLTWKRFAMPLAPSTNQSAPHTKSTKPTINNAAATHQPPVCIHVFKKSNI